MAKEREATFRCIEGGLKVMQKIGTDMPQAQNITAVYLLFTKKLDVLRFEEQARNVFLPHVSFTIVKAVKGQYQKDRLAAERYSSGLKMSMESS